MARVLYFQCIKILVPLSVFNKTLTLCWYLRIIQAEWNLTHITWTRITCWGLIPVHIKVSWLGTIHILRNHFYSKKLNLTSKFFTKTGFFSSNQKNYFFNIKFWQIFHSVVWFLRRASCKARLLVITFFVCCKYLCPHLVFFVHISLFHVCQVVTFTKRIKMAVLFWIFLDRSVQNG